MYLANSNGRGVYEVVGGSGAPGDEVDVDASPRVVPCTSVICQVKRRHICWAYHWTSKRLNWYLDPQEIHPTGRIPTGPTGYKKQQKMHPAPSDWGGLRLPFQPRSC